MKKVMDIILANVGKVVAALAILVASLVGSYSGSFVASVPIPADSVLGALSGPDISSPYLNVNGVTKQYRSIALNQASTTICSLRSPAATSTLVFGSVKILTPTTTTISLEIAKSTVPDATTTRLAYDLSVAGQTTMVVAVGTSTDATAPSNVVYTIFQDDLIFAPNTYLNVKYGSTLGITNTLVGSCKAEFIEN